MEQWLSPRGSQHDCGFFSEEEKQESKHIEYSAPEESIISNQSTDGVITTMVFITWSDKIKRPKVRLDGPLCGGLNKGDHGSIVPWSGTDTDSKMNSLTWSK